MDGKPASRPAAETDLTQARIFHGLHDIASIPSNLARSERLLGLNSTSVCHANPLFRGRADELATGSGEEQLAKHFPRFDIFNFHFGISFLQQSLADLPLLRRAGKIVGLHYHGCDIRDSKRVLAQYPISACAECWPMACNANRRFTELKSRYADFVTVSTPDLLEFVPGSIWLPQAVDLEYVARTAVESLPAFERKDAKTVYVVHAPSATRLKGTRFLETAVADLQKKGVPVELVMLTKVKHESVLASLQAADIVVDQLLLGPYGVLSIEAMSLGKPTLCYIRDDLAAAFPRDLPIVRCTPDDVGQRIVELIEERKSWPARGERSIAYARTHHDGRRAAETLRAVYEHHLGSRAHPTLDASPAV